jgi:F0F1-type ATP synthase membrane subunit c/vacuolar-type H+-ATPase subunit K
VKNKRLVYTAVQIFLTAVVFAMTVTVHAQDDMSVAVRKIIADSQSETGDIVSLTTQNELVRSQASFDPNMYGVVAETATIIYHPTEEGTPITRQGTAIVNVTTLTGDILPGDIITSSQIPGKGQKTAVAEGWILGRALTGFSQGQGVQITFEGRTLSVGQIEVDLRIGPAAQGAAGNISRLVDQLGSVLLQNVETPSGTNDFLRYIVAALVAIAVIGIGFGSFGRNITRGIEAIGRNPLAKRQIQAMIALNIFLIGIISLLGIILALAIIRS